MRPSRARRLLGCALAGLIAGAGVLAGVAGGAAGAVSPSSAPVSGPASEAVTVEGRTQPSRLAVKRHGYYHNVSIHNLVWSNWGQTSTTARGIFTFQFCVHESCSVSPFYDEPAAVTLGGVRRCDGRVSYTTLSLDIEASMPDSSFERYRTSLGACRKPGSRGG